MQIMQTKNTSKTTNASPTFPTHGAQIIVYFTTTCKVDFSIVMLFRNLLQHTHLLVFMHDFHHF